MVITPNETVAKSSIVKSSSSIYLYGMNWVYVKETNSSISTQAAQISLVAAIIASVCCGPVGGIVVSVASYCISESINNLYYRKIYDQSTTGHYWLWQTYYYTDKSHTNFVRFITYDSYTGVYH